MNFMLAWQILNPKAAPAAAELEAALTGRRWVRAIPPSVFVVPVQDADDYQTVVAALLGVASRYSPHVLMLISPLTYDRDYQGWIKRDVWPHIRGE